MTLDGFLILLTLIAAVYALAPETTRLNLKLRMGVPMTLSIIALIAVLYLEFFDLVRAHCPTMLSVICAPRKSTEDDTLNSAEIAFLVVLAWGVLLAGWARLRPARLTPHRLPVLAQLLAELGYERKFSEIAKVVTVPSLVVLEFGVRQSPAG
jgi:hypothetical protein